MTPLLRRLRSELEELQKQLWHEYYVPGRWVGANDRVRFASAPAYFLYQLNAVERLMQRNARAPWSASSITYNAFVRHVTSYDHGKGPADDGWRVTGSFLKLLALLPYLRSMGVATLCLLPITEIGEVGHKGTLGSPYAVRHPFRLDPNLAEPCLGMSVDDQCRMLIEACHMLGMKVVLEVVLRTAAVDSDMVLHHPEWFYWVDEARVRATGRPFSAPSFTDDELVTIKQHVTVNNFKKLPEPSVEYRALFEGPPKRIEHDELGWKGVQAHGHISRIPGAFADWPPDDPQPAWSDVTYMRLHDHSHYRYMAYNTVRMFERTLDVPQYRNHALWNTIASIIPHSIRTLNIDGALIDMGHALPPDLRQRVVQEARQQKPGLLLWEETFDITAASRAKGYDAVVGYVPFDAHDPKQMCHFIERVAQGDMPLRWYAAAETHNTPRAASRDGGAAYASAVWTLLRTLPTGVPFICSGFELGETTPINTGLGFSEEELAAYPDTKLPLFSDVPLPWDNKVQIDSDIRALEQRLLASSWYALAKDDDEIVPLNCDADDIVGFVRYTPSARRGIVVVANLSAAPVELTITLSNDATLMLVEPNDAIRLLSGNRLSITLEAWSAQLSFCVTHNA